MRTLRPQSFRRLLIFRLLLLGIPILLIGQYVTLRKARTGLLETARQNLTSSAVRKAESLKQSAYLMINQVQTLAQIQAIRVGDLPEIETVLQQFTHETRLSQSCVQVLAIDDLEVVASSCRDAAKITSDRASRLEAVRQGQADFALLRAASSGNVVVGVGDTPDAYTQIEMSWAAPIYGPDSALRYVVVLQSRLSQLENVNARSLIGYTVLLDEAGTVLVHPDPLQEGEPLQNLNETERLQTIIRSAQTGERATLHLFEFLPGYGEWLAGYSSLDIEVAPGQMQQWTMLAVAPLDHSLQGLADIRNVLLLLTLGLLTAQVLLILYLAQCLSWPIERLCQYAQEIQDLSNFEEVPQNFRIWELNHLARVFNGMMKRLELRAHELRHAWQDAQIANQLKSEFLANTSHELRTPLNAIIGCIRLIKDGCCDSPEETEEFLDTADQAAVHLLGVINDILDIAKIESGTLRLHPAVVDIRQIISEVLDLQNLQIKAKGLTLRYARSADPLWVKADRAKLKQVLLNLVYNAVKFTDAGDITISTCLETECGHCPAFNPLVLEKLSTPYPRIVVGVTDTGIGISPSQQEHLFHPFVMADGSTTRQHEGTGLGLAISHNLIRLMQGNIALYSAGIGEGTQVIFALPAVMPTEATEGLTTRPEVRTR